MIYKSFLQQSVKANLNKKHFLKNLVNGMIFLHISQQTHQCCFPVWRSTDNVYQGSECSWWHMVIGARVTRGLDWKWGDQDGPGGTPGE